MNLLEQLDAFMKQNTPPTEIKEQEKIILLQKQYVILIQERRRSP